MGLLDGIRSEKLIEEKLVSPAEEEGAKAGAPHALDHRGSQPPRCRHLAPPPPPPPPRQEPPAPGARHQQGQPSGSARGGLQAARARAVGGRLSWSRALELQQGGESQRKADLCRGDPPQGLPNRSQKNPER